MTDKEMLQLLRKEYPEGKQQSAVPDLWDLASTASMKINPKTGEPGLEYFWQLRTCAVCGALGCVAFDQVKGYRCEDHRI